jgi:hypothetical protein
MVVGTKKNVRGYTSSSKGLLAKQKYERQVYIFAQ